VADIEFPAVVEEGPADVFLEDIGAILSTREPLLLKQDSPELGRSPDNADAVAPIGLLPRLDNPHRPVNRRHRLQRVPGPDHIALGDGLGEGLVGQLAVVLQGLEQAFFVTDRVAARQVVVQPGGAKLDWPEGFTPRNYLRKVGYAFGLRAVDEGPAVLLVQDLAVKVVLPFP
jgi:hypothetical protein